MSSSIYNLDNMHRLVTSSVGAVLAYWDKDEVCRFANASYKEWMGKAPDEMIEKMTIAEVLGKELYSKQRPFIAKVLNGEKQSFEREFTLPNGEMRRAFVMYYPDIVENEVRGFIVHGIDMTPIKNLETKLLAQEKEKNNHILQSMIYSQEGEREALAVKLRDNISQTLSYCKIMLESRNKEKSSKTDDKVLLEILDQISMTVDELIAISSGLSSSVIVHFGLLTALEEHIASFAKTFAGDVDFNCSYEGIESISDKRKTSIFRIIQNFLLLLKSFKDCNRVNIVISHQHADNFLELQLRYHSHNKIDIYSREYSEIQNRVIFNNGSLIEMGEDGSKVLLIKLDILN
ncbi:PAS domain-containing protein [Ferruginibacter albus]|uniref:PAS domain-containing protein n=1 Tax=Ferruginibacter albus TaxID=2875540 RepID=UPI001CC5FC59|nr:PAS domain-containing protein [Ferruginibacter albus]UAY51357.1 PAS domain-containing protein [Ferruginibacter albus]